jgi:hypothetical protein
MKCGRVFRLCQYTLSVVSVRLQLCINLALGLQFKKIDSKNTVTKTHVFEMNHMYSQTVLANVRDSTHDVQVNCILVRKDLLVPEMSIHMIDYKIYVYTRAVRKTVAWP